MFRERRRDHPARRREPAGRDRRGREGRRGARAARSNRIEPAGNPRRRRRPQGRRHRLRRPRRADQRRRRPPAAAILDPLGRHGRRRAAHEGAAPQVGRDRAARRHRSSATRRWSTTRGLPALPRRARGVRRPRRAPRRRHASSWRPTARGRAELFEDLGYEPVAVDISEFQKLEGCVTCLSVRLRGLDRRTPPSPWGRATPAPCPWARARRAGARRRAWRPGPPCWRGRCPAASSAAGGPTPSSVTRRHTSPSTSDLDVDPRCAWAWRATLLSASRSVASSSAPTASSTPVSTGPSSSTRGSNPSGPAASRSERQDAVAQPVAGDRGAAPARRWPCGCASR